MTAGAEEPNALVQVGAGARTEPNVRATQVELFEGLVAASAELLAQSVEFDVGAVNNLVRAPASRPASTTRPSCGRLRFWMFYEHFIRKAAGMGGRREPTPTATTTPRPLRRAGRRRRAGRSRGGAGAGRSGAR